MYTSDLNNKIVLTVDSQNSLSHNKPYSYKLIIFKIFSFISFLSGLLQVVVLMRNSVYELRGFWLKKLIRMQNFIVMN